MTIVSIFRGGDFGNLAGWYSYFFGTIIRHTRVVTMYYVTSSIQLIHTKYSVCDLIIPFGLRPSDICQQTDLGLYYRFRFPLTSKLDTT